MSNKYNLPEKEIERIRKRDKKCVYCGKIMVNSRYSENRKDWATIEHLNHLPPWDNPSTVAICCGSCNSSRGDKKLLNWFKGEYCIKSNINKRTVAKPVKDYLKSIS